jgi:peptidoglycan/xylan/chitin deacetylase (PgdA/CDA1 family)
MYLHSTPKLIKKYYRRFVWDKADSTNSSIYLTFDDGPIPGLTEYVLSELDVVSARATFFCVGNNIHKHPDIFSDLISRGHSFGNHTFNHLNGLKTKKKEYLENVKLCDREISKSGFSRLRKLFRPPYGMIKAGQAKELLPDYDIIMWDVLSGDFDKGLNPDKCLEKTIKSTRPGSIVVFHDNYKAERTVKYVLPRYLNYFAEKGFTFEAL